MIFYYYRGINDLYIHSVKGKIKKKNRLRIIHMKRQMTRAKKIYEIQYKQTRAH